jgi:hypothetical protein
MDMNIPKTSEFPQIRADESKHLSPVTSSLITTTTSARRDEMKLRA